MKKTPPNTSKQRPQIQASASETAGAGELFLVATPIGNLGDITLRALETLKSVDLIACEDTRTSGVLLRHYGITTRTVAHHAHNEASSAESLVSQLQQGARMALISDAGTPLLSDPGGRLVTACIEAGIRVTPIPGASALLSALCVAGLPIIPSYFAGFLPPKSQARRAAFAAIKPLQSTLVFYEAPTRLADSLEDAAATLGDRQAAVARELTKLHEECRRGTLSELQRHYTAHPPRGECVLLIAGAEDATPPSSDEIETLLKQLLSAHSVKEAASLAAEQTGLPKRDLYQRALTLKA